MSAVWAGVDVGARRKGFDVAVVDDARRVVRLDRCALTECVALIEEVTPRVVGIDAPSAWAVDGERSRACERAFARAHLCGIRFTPDAPSAAARTDDYLEWIEHGLELWRALTSSNITVIECFPTASWTAWFGDRNGESRAAWTRSGVRSLRELGVDDLGAARSQDQRDAVAAALTARQWDRAPQTVDRFGDLCVPRRGTAEAAAGISHDDPVSLAAL